MISFEYRSWIRREKYSYRSPFVKVSSYLGEYEQGCMENWPIQFSPRECVDGSRVDVESASGVDKA